MAALAADTEAAAGGGREVEKVFAALLRGDGGGLTHSGTHALLSPAWTAAMWRPAGEILRWAATQPRRTRRLLQEPLRTSSRLIRSPCSSGIFTIF